MVQSELHPEDERQPRDGNSSESSSNETPEGISEPVATDTTPPIGDLGDSLAFEQERAVRRAALRARAGEELLTWIKTFASAAVYATLIVTFGFQVARVEGKSMEPTLQDQDRLIVNKAAYRFFGEPKPGDVVMLFYPRDPDKSFVKRVVAEEGDTVRIEEGQVYVNEELQPDLFVPPEFRSYENHGPEVVKDAYYFVMGDHRNNSSDSRHWGQVPQKYIIGRVQLRWWPLSDARLF
jgi:signal peptidase I